MRIMKEWGGDTFFNDGVYGGAHTENKPRTSTWQMADAYFSYVNSIQSSIWWLQICSRIFSKNTYFGLLDLEVIQESLQYFILFREI